MCREHYLVLELDLEGSGIEDLLGGIDRAVSRSRDPLVSAFGQFVSGLFSSKRRAPSAEEQRQWQEQWEAERQRARSQQQQHARRPPPPPPPSSPPPDPLIEARRVLGFEPADKLTKEIVHKRKQALARVFHPDMPGGSEAAMKRVNQAADTLLAKLA